MEESVPNLAPTPEPKRNFFLTPKFWFSLLAILALAIAGFLYWQMLPQKTGELNKEVPIMQDGSAEYRTYIEGIDKLNEQWLEMETKMEAQGSTQEEIKLAHYDFIEFFVSTLILQIKFESNLTNNEKEKVASKIMELVSSAPSAAEIEKICRQTEELLPTPIDLQGATFVLENDAYLAIGKEKDSCSPSFINVEMELVSNDTISNSTIGKEYFEKEGRKVEKLLSGKKFTLEKILLVKSNKMFSDTPIDHLILKDDQGKLYQVATIYLNNNHEERIHLSYSKNGKKLGVLDWEYFMEFKIKLIEEKTKDISYQLNNLADTTGWKLFTDAGKKYQIKYPESWKVTPASEMYSADSFLGPNGTIIAIDGDSEHGDYNLARFKEELQHQIPITIDGRSAFEGLKTNNSGEPTKYITFMVLLNEPINGVYYRFTFMDFEGDKTHSYQYLPVFNSMLKSFKIETTNNLNLSYDKDNNYDKFATCLKDKGAVFYGTFWCPHCQAQKKMFGSSAKLLPYVECSTSNGQSQTQICMDKKISVYPTWEFSNGSRVTGELSLEELANRTKCQLSGETEMIMGNPEEISGWKIYESQKHGFKFRYSPEWKVQDNTDISSLGEYVMSQRTPNGKNNYLYFTPKSTALSNPIPGNPIISYEELDSKFAIVHTWQSSDALFKRYYMVDSIPGWKPCTYPLTNSLSCGKIEYYSTNDALLVDIYKSINSIEFN